MKITLKLLLASFISIALFACSQPIQKNEISAKDILGNPNYLAISYGGYRKNTRDIQPSIEELKDDMKILNAMGIKVLRTYNTKLKQASNLLEAISQLKKEDANFEMYVMLGAWINCENAWKANPNHEAEDVKANTEEIERAVVMANKYPDIVKIISVGNEAMVHWASSYYVTPTIILKWVNHLQELKKIGKLPSDLWITSSDNFASWGGGDESYHLEDLTKLLNAVDFVSMHTYPFHDTHYNDAFWKFPENESSLTSIEQAESSMLRAKEYAISQYESVANYMKLVGVNKPIHIGETGWASIAGTTQYGEIGSGAADEYKAKLYYNHMRDWTNSLGVSCFYFEAFDENWKDAQNQLGSENHFGLITMDGKAKYVLWDLVDTGAFKSLTRNGNAITKTFQGDKEALLNSILKITHSNSTE
jgi:exo-beta-1,3-glucanase (GH17 family)